MWYVLLAYCYTLFTQDTTHPQVNIFVPYCEYAHVGTFKRCGEPQPLSGLASGPSYMECLERRTLAYSVWAVSHPNSTDHVTQTVTVFTVSTCLCLNTHAGSTVVPLTTFVIGNIFFVVLDLTGKPSVMLKYKIQEDKHVPVSVPL